MPFPPASTRVIFSGAMSPRAIDVGPVMATEVPETSMSKVAEAEPLWAVTVIVLFRGSPIVDNVAAATPAWSVLGWVTSRVPPFETLKFTGISFSKTPFASLIRAVMAARAAAEESSRTGLAIIWILPTTTCSGVVSPCTSLPALPPPVLPPTFTKGVESPSPPQAANNIASDRADTRARIFPDIIFSRSLQQKPFSRRHLGLFGRGRFRRGHY